MSSLILNPSNSGSGSVTLNIFGDDTEYNINLPKTNGTLVSSVNGKTANNNGSVTIDVGVKSVNGVAPDSKGNVVVKVQSVASSDEAVAGTDNTKMMTPLRTKESVQQFSPTDYVTGLSVSGQTVTFTKKNGTTGKITTQDTKYTHPNSGVSAGTYNTVTVNAQGHVTGGNNAKYVKSVDNISADVNGNVSLGLHAVATSGNYNDLSNKPSIPPATRMMPDYSSSVQIAKGDYTPTENGWLRLADMNNGDYTGAKVIHKASGSKLFEFYQNRYPGTATGRIPVRAGETYTVSNVGPVFFHRMR